MRNLVLHKSVSEVFPDMSVVIDHSGHAFYLSLDDLCCVTGFDKNFVAKFEKSWKKSKSIIKDAKVLTDNGFKTMKLYGVEFLMDLCFKYNPELAAKFVIYGVTGDGGKTDPDDELAAYDIEPSPDAIKLLYFVAVNDIMMNGLFGMNGTQFFNSRNKVPGKKISLPDMDELFDLMTDEEMNKVCLVQKTATKLIKKGMEPMEAVSKAVKSYWKTFR